MQRTCSSSPLHAMPEFDHLAHVFTLYYRGCQTYILNRKEPCKGLNIEDMVCFIIMEKFSFDEKLLKFIYFDCSLFGYHWSTFMWKIIV